MLETAENLAAGLGTQPKLSKAHASPTKAATTTVAAGESNTVGNAHLRLWVGKRFLGTLTLSTYTLSSDFLNIVELYNRAGDKEGAKVQTLKNANFMEAVARVEMEG